MQKNWLLLCFYAFLLAACTENNDFKFSDHTTATPSDSLIDVYAPMSGATLPRNTPFIFEYEVVRGKKGAYVKIQVDNQVPVTVHKTSGQHQIDGLAAGPHTISITEYTKEGKPTGGYTAVNVTMH